MKADKTQDNIYLCTLHYMCMCSCFFAQKSLSIEVHPGLARFAVIYYVWGKLTLIVSFKNMRRRPGILQSIRRCHSKINKYLSEIKRFVLY